MKTPQDLAAATTQFSLSPQQDHWSVVQNPKAPLRPVCWHTYTSQDAARLPLTLSPRCQGTALRKRGRPEFLRSSCPWKTSRSSGPALTRSFAAEAGKGSHSTRHTSSFASESSQAQHSRHWEMRRTEWIHYQGVPAFLKADKCLGSTNPIRTKLTGTQREQNTAISPIILTDSLGLMPTIKNNLLLYLHNA